MTRPALRIGWSLSACVAALVVASAATAQPAPKPASPPSSATEAEATGDGASDVSEPTEPASPEPEPRLPEVDPRGRTVDSAAAESLFRAGKALMDEGRTDEACPRFEASFQAEPSGGTLLNLALCHQLQGRTASAWAEYRKAADMIRAAGQPQRADEAMRYALELEPRLSTLAVTVPHPVDGLRVVRGGVLLSQGAWGVALPLDPGRHEIVATAPGHERWSAQIELGAAGDRKAVAVPVLRPEPASPREPTAEAPSAGLSSGYLAGLVMGATGLVAVGVGAVLGVVASGDVDEAESDESLCGADRLCTPAGQDVVDRARTEARAATLTIGIGAALAAAGVVLILVSPETGAAGSAEGQAAAFQLSADPWIGPSTTGLHLEGRF